VAAEKKFKDIKDLTPVQMDALKEVGNIGAGNAATALSKILNRMIDMSVPEIKITHINKVADLVGGPEVPVVGVYLEMSGDAPGHIMFILPIDSARNLVNMMTESDSQEESFDELEISALNEIGNILASSYLVALTGFTGLALYPSVPSLSLDMAGAILNVVLIELSMIGDYALVIETIFKEGERAIKGFFFLIPDPGTLEIILSSLGVENY